MGRSGGVWGISVGYDDGRRRRYLILDVLAGGTCRSTPARYFGPTGAGHYVKMVHNGVEYVMMQVHAEALAVRLAEDQLDNAVHSPTLDGRARRARGCASWPRACSEQEGTDLELDRAVRGGVSGEGRWTVEDAID